VAQPCPNVLASPHISQYPTPWDQLCPPNQRRQLYTGLGSPPSGEELARLEDHPSVDLEADTVSDNGTLQTWIDIDSAGGFVSSLAVARAGLQWKAGRAAISNLHSSLHLSKITVQWKDPATGRLRQGRQPIHQVPHLPFGRLVGFPEVEMYILFPRLYQPHREHWVITQKEYTLWTDQILMPALHLTFPASTLQHLPASAAHITLTTSAARGEGQALPGVHAPRAQDLHFRLAPDGLPALWHEMQQRMEQAGLHQFQQCQILLTAKNLKVSTQRSTWSHARAAFFDRWNQAVDATYLKQDFYDVAREIVSSQSTHFQDSSPGMPLTLTWRRCCLTGFADQLDQLDRTLAEAHAQSLSSRRSTPQRSSRATSPSPAASPAASPAEVVRDEREDQGSTSYHADSSSDESSSAAEEEVASEWSELDDGEEVTSEWSEPDDEPSRKPSRRLPVRWRREFYPQSLLRDQGVLTLEPQPATALWKQGLRYCQLYNTTKEIFSAGKQYPFQNARFDTLALDPGMVRTWQHVGGAVGHSPLAILHAYLHTKERCHVALHSCRHRSYGTREEYRITGPALVALDQLFRERGLAETPLPTSPYQRPFFVHPTPLMIDWLRWNMNKLCLGFELTYSLQPRTMVHWEHTRVMMMFLQCLRNSYGGQGRHLRHSNGLWLDRRVRAPTDGAEVERIQEGMGLGPRLERTGYAWFADKIDWASMTIRPPHRDHIAFNTPTLQSAYHERYQRVVEVKSDFIFFHDVIDLLRRHRPDFRRSALLLQLLVDLCLQLFRKDVFHTLAHAKLHQPLQPTEIQEACAGAVPLTGGGLCRVFIQSIFQDDIYFVTGSRAAVTHLDVLFARLWGWDGDGQQGDWPRKHWEYKPYRVLYRQCFGIIAQIHGMQQAREWRRRLRHTWIRTHYILPYPDATSFWPRRADRRFQTWASVHPQLEVYYRHYPLSTGVIPYAEVDQLPTSGWERGHHPNKLDITLPPIPSDLDSWLDTVQLPSAAPVPTIPLPSAGVVDGQISRYLRDNAPSRRTLRSFMHEQELTEAQIHQNHQWLHQHLADYLQAIVATCQKEIIHHQLPAMARGWQRRPRSQLSSGLAGLNLTIQQVEDDDSDPENPCTQAAHRARRLGRMRKRLDLARAEVKRNLWCENYMQLTHERCKDPRQSFSRDEWRAEVGKYRSVREQYKMSNKRLERLSRQATRID
jgi:hypothetical protein